MERMTNDSIPDGVYVIYVQGGKVISLESMQGFARELTEAEVDQVHAYLREKYAPTATQGGDPDVVPVRATPVDEKGKGNDAE